MYIYDRSAENENEYLTRPRQCLPVAYVIYHKKRPTPPALVPVYHFHCTGVMNAPPVSAPAMATIDLTCDDENRESSVASTAVVPGTPGSSTVQRSPTNHSSVNWRQLERHFMSLIRDMLPPELHQRQNSAGAVDAAATLTSPGVSGASSVASSASSSSAVFMFPASFSSTSSASSMERLQTAVTSCSSRQTARQPMSGRTVAGAVSCASDGTLNSAELLTRPGGTLSSSLPGTDYRPLAPTQAGGRTVVSNLQSADGLSQLLSSLMPPRSTNVTRHSQCVATQTPLYAARPITVQSVLPSSPMRILPVARTLARLAGVSTAATSTVTSTARFRPPPVVKLPIPAVTTRAIGRGAQVHAVACFPQSHKTQSGQNYRVFRLQPPLQPRQPSRPSLTQFNLPSVCTGSGVNVTSASSAQPAPSVTTVASQHQPLTASITSASSGVSWIAGMSGGPIHSSTSANEDEFVDVETLSTNQLPPIVIAPDDSIDDYNLPADCAVQDVDVKNERMSPRLRKSMLRQRGEVICIDDDEGLEDIVNSADNGTQDNFADVRNTEAGLQMCFDNETNDEHTLLSGADDIPAINIVPDDADCSPIQFDYSQASDTSVSVDFPLQSPVLSSVDTTVPGDTTVLGTLLLRNSDTINVAPPVASCTASSDTFSPYVSSTRTPCHTETDGTYLTSLANSRGIPSTSSAQVAEARNSLEGNSAHTLHYLPSPSVFANNLSSACVPNVITPRPIIAAPITPVLFSLQPSFCVVPALVSLPPPPPPVNSVPLVTSAPLAPSVARTCDVTAMAAQLVSGLRSDAMRRRATSAAKVAVLQSTQSGPACTELRQKRGRTDDDSDADMAAKSARYVPPILNRFNRSAKEPAKRCSKPASSDTPDSHRQGETVVYHLNDDGSIEIRIEKSSITENSSQHRKQVFNRGGFNAIVELGRNASQSWYSDSFLSDMEKHFDSLKVVSLFGNDTATSDKSRNVPELRAAGGSKQKSKSAVDKILDSQITSDNDSVDTVSLICSSVEPSDEEDNQTSVADQEEADSSSLKITNICSIDAEAFTDLRSVVSDIPQEIASAGQAAEDAEICRRRDDVRSIDATVNTADNKNDTETRCDKHNVGKRTLHDANSNRSAECRIDRARNKSSVDDEEEMFSDSGDTSLFEVSLDGDLLIDTETESVASPERTVVRLSDLDIPSSKDNNSQQSIEQQTLDGQIHPSTQSSNDDSGEADKQLSSVLPEADDECTVEPANCRAADDTVSNESRLTVETSQSSTSDESRNSVILRLHAEQDETASRLSEAANENVGEKRQSSTEVSSEYSSDFRRSDSHVTSWAVRDNAAVKDSVTQSSQSMNMTAGLCTGENVHSPLIISDDDETTSPLSPSVNMTTEIRTSRDFPGRLRTENISKNSYSSDVGEESRNTGNNGNECLQTGAGEGRLDQFDDTVSGKKAVLAVKITETEKSGSATREIGDPIHTEPISPAPELCVTDADLSDVEPDDSSITAAGSLEVDSGSLMLVAEKSEAAAECSYSSRLVTESVSPPLGDISTELQRSRLALTTLLESVTQPVLLPEKSDRSAKRKNLVVTEPVSPVAGVSSLPDCSGETGPCGVEPGDNLSATESTRCSYNNLIVTKTVSPLPEGPSESNHSNPTLPSPPVPVPEKLQTTARRSNNKSIDTESVLPVAESVVEAGQESVSLAVRAADEPTPSALPSCDNTSSVTGHSCDADTHLHDVVSNNCSPAVTSLPVPVAEQLDSETALRYNVEQVSPVHQDHPSDIHTDLDDDSSPASMSCDKPDHVPISETEISASVMKDNVIDIELASPLPEPLPATRQDLLSPPLPVTEKVASPARRTCDNLIDTHPVSPVAEPLRRVPEPERNIFNLYLANLAAAPVTEKQPSGTELGTSKPCEIKSYSALSVFDRSLLDVRPISPTWSSTERVASEPRYKHARLGVHQVNSKASLVPKVPKRITLADYRKKKTASQVCATDNVCKHFERNQDADVADSCETVSEVSVSRSISRAAEVTVSSPLPVTEKSSSSVGHLYGNLVDTRPVFPVTEPACDVGATEADGVVIVSDPSHECSGGSRLDSAGSADYLPVSCTLGPTELPPPTVSVATDLTGSSSSAAENTTSHSIGADAQTEQETNTSSDADDSSVAAEIADTCAREHSPGERFVEMTEVTEHSDAVSAASCADVEHLSPSSPCVDDIATNCSNDDKNTNSIPEITEGPRSPESSVDDNRDTVEATSSLCGTDAEILDDLLLDFARSSEKVKKAERKLLSKKHKESRKPLSYTLIPVDMYDLGNGEPAASSPSTDVVTSPGDLHSCEQKFELRDLSVTIPLEPLDMDSHCCSKTSLLTDSSELSSVVEDDVYCTETETIDGQNDTSTAPHLTNTSAETEDNDALKADVSLPMQASSSVDISFSTCAESDDPSDEGIILSPLPAVSNDSDIEPSDKQVEDISTPTCIQSAQPTSCSIIVSTSSAVSTEMEADPSSAQCVTAGGQHIATTCQSSISSLSEINLNSSHFATTSQLGLETSDTSDSSHKLAVASKTGDIAQFSLEECTSRNTVAKEDGTKNKEMRPRKGHLKVAAMWQDSMRGWMHLDMSKNKDVTVPRFTLSSDYFVMRQHVVRLLRSVARLSPKRRDHVKGAVLSSLKATEQLLQEELVYIDISTQLNDSQAKLLTDKQRRMIDLLSSVESQLRELSMELHHMSDAEAELSCYEKSDWSTESGLHFNILLLTRHMLYKEMSSLRCYHNSRLVYRLPDELCLDVERDRFVSVEGCILFLEYSILSLVECQQLFALKVEIAETQSELAQLDNDSPGSDEFKDVALRLGWLHSERRQRFQSISVKSVHSQQTLQAFLSQQLHWYRYVKLFSYSLLVYL